jgi:excisionase family DNA binding protein
MGIIREVYTTKQACEYLQITKLTLYKLIREKRVKCNKLGKDYRFLKSDLDKLVRGEMNNER